MVPYVFEDLTVFHFSFTFLDQSESAPGEGSQSNLL